MHCFVIPIEMAPIFLRHRIANWQQIRDCLADLSTGEIPSVNNRKQPSYRVLRKGKVMHSVTDIAKRRSDEIGTRRAQHYTKNIRVHKEKLNPCSLCL